MSWFLKRRELVWHVPAEQPELAPQRATGGSLGFDLRTPTDIEIPPATPNGVGTKRVNMMISVTSPKGYGLLFLSRSSLASKGITVEGGLIDNDFTGILQVIIYNHTGQTFKFNKLDKIAQAILVPLVKTKITYSDKYPDPTSTKRGSGGFGSTGN